VTEGIDIRHDIEIGQIIEFNPRKKEVNNMRVDDVEDPIERAFDLRAEFDDIMSVEEANSKGLMLE
jgi:3'-phosphoadenosine 5'-phosphosulfate sulfotransferase